MYIKKRNIALCILFSILTFGLYGLYWVYCLAEDTGSAAARKMPGGGAVLLFSILTCGIYQLYWFYRAGDALDELRQGRGRGTGHLAILYLVLGLLGFHLVSYALMQYELNEYAQ